MFTVTGPRNHLLSPGMPLRGGGGPALTLRPGVQVLLRPGVRRAVAQRRHLGQLHGQPRLLLGRGHGVDGGVPGAHVRAPGHPAGTLLPVLPHQEGTQVGSEGGSFSQVHCTVGMVKHYFRISLCVWASAVSRCCIMFLQFLIHL